MRGVRAILVPKRDIIISGCKHFSADRQYIATYELGEKDRGWYTIDDVGAKHWLSPWDGKDHMDIHEEEWIVKNFYIIEVK